MAPFFFNSVRAMLAQALLRFCCCQARRYFSSTQPVLFHEHPIVPLNRSRARVKRACCCTP